MKKITVLMVALLALCIGAIASYLYLKNQIVSKEQENITAKKPLYWVAPMDPNYQRDKPGLSPMGMALEPVYAQPNDKKSATKNAGITISGAVSQQINIQTQIVTSKHWEKSINSFAMFTYDEDSIVHLHSRVSGWVEKLFIKSQGQKVTKGEPLYTFYSPELAHAQEELVLAIKSNNKQLVEGATRKLRSLYVPQVAIDEIKKHRQVLSTITYYAPSSGYVDNINIRQGMYVKPEIEMLSINTLEELWLIAEVFVSDLPNITTQMPLKYSVEAFPNTDFNGYADFIYPNITKKDNLARVRIRVDNTQQNFLPGMQAKVSFNYTDPVKSIVVPSQSIIRTGTNERVVLKISETEFITRSVNVEDYHEGYAKVTSGLDTGDNIVTSSQFLIDSQASTSQTSMRMNEEPTSSKSITSETVSSETVSSETVTSGELSPHATHKIEVLPWVEGKIVQVNNKKSLTISHNEISEWQRAAMTMDFIFSPTEFLTFSSFKAGDDVRFTFTKKGKDFTIIDIEKVTVTLVPESLKGHHHD